MNLRRLRLALPLLAVLGGPAAFAQPVPAGETADPPSRQRLAAVEEAAAGPGGWAGVVQPLRDAAVAAYGSGRVVAAEAWFHAYRWAGLFAEPEGAFVDGWVRAIQANRLNYSGMQGQYPNDARPLATFLSPPMQAWLIEHPAFSEQFFSNVKDVDYLPRVLATLEGLHRRSPERFERYPALCLAIALVYDVPPPPYWPHIQVTPGSLPRKLPNAAVPFDYFTREDMEGRTFLRLSQLRVEELKFVVDGGASVAEKGWAVSMVPYPLDQLEQVYDMVRYRDDRAANPALNVWAGPPYTLQAILEQGGICIDQAYFATEVGKARGVPTLLFRGRGQDGRHAWFGFLDGERRWRLDAGRYAEQRLVTGYALDPQTWTEISDHELQFLSERFRALPTFMQSRVHQEFAADFLQQGDAAAAARAARTSVSFESRNLAAWEVLLASQEKLGMPAARREAVMREVVLAFAKYPDLVVEYGNRIVASLRGRGETSLADYEERSLAERMKGDRMDLSIQQAAAILARSLQADPVERQIATYNAILAQYGHGAGTTFFDEVVVAFVEHLKQLHMNAQARDALERARDALAVQPGTQLSGDIEALLVRLQG